MKSSYFQENKKLYNILIVVDDPSILCYTNIS
nr:MAG TPA: hypothetical protein [Caudoviricetes sp.]DAX49670.1 MAG TPA: hypothetical protein [Caudoviricetes sp.]